MNDLTWRRFGRLVVVSVAGELKGRMTRWLCRCDCGKTKLASGADLLTKHTRSCGCLHSETARKTIVSTNKTHGKTHTRLFSIWTNMRTRCYNVRNKTYQWYGKRGIKICDEWRDNFQAFYDWAIENGYKQNLSIDRINNDGDYCPENCRWTTTKAQMRNTSKTVNFTTSDGVTKCLSDWAKFLGITNSAFLKRVDRYGVDIAVTMESKRRYPRIIEFNGITDTVAGWASRIGICKTTLQGRLNTMPLEKALTMPPQKNAPSLKNKKEAA